MQFVLIWSVKTDLTGASFSCQKKSHGNINFKIRNMTLKNGTNVLHNGVKHIKEHPYCSFETRKQQNNPG